MAISKILHMGAAKSGYKAKHLSNALNYITDPEKTEGGRFVSGNNCMAETALEQMLDTKRRFNKMDRRQGYHIVISFEENEVDEETAYDIIGRFVKEYLGDDYEAVYTLHTDTDHLHGHIVYNSVKCTDGYKYEYKKGDWEKYIQPVVNRLCSERNLSTIDLDKVREKRESRQQTKEKKEWDQSKNGTFIWNDMIKKDVDHAILQADTYDEFLFLIKDKGYEIKFGKHLGVKPPGMERYRRLDTLGSEYGEDVIKARLSISMKSQNIPLIPTVDRKKSPRIVSYYIPRKKRRLTPYQKRYFAKLYRIGKLKKRPYTQAWKYKESIKKLHKLQREYRFIMQYHVETETDIKISIQHLTEQGKILTKEKKELDEKIVPYKFYLSILDKIEELQVEKELYLGGYKEFALEYKEYEALSKELLMMGYPLEKIVDLRLNYKKKLEEIKEKQKDIRMQKRIGNTLLKENKEKIQKKGTHKNKKERRNENRRER